MNTWEYGGAGESDARGLQVQAGATWTLLICQCSINFPSSFVTSTTMATSLISFKPHLILSSSHMAANMLTPSDLSRSKVLMLLASLFLVAIFVYQILVCQLFTVFNTLS